MEAEVDNYDSMKSKVHRNASDFCVSQNDSSAFLLGLSKFVNFTYALCTQCQCPLLTSPFM